METNTEIGRTIHRLRLAKGLSLRTLAGKAGFSASFLSQLENGLTSPSIASLEKLAGTLGLSLLDFFEQLESDSKESGCLSERKPLTSGWSKARVERLLPQGALKHLDGIEITISAGGRSGKDPLVASTEQLIYVLEGRLDLTVDRQSYALESGMAGAILWGEAYQWRNPGPDRARILIVGAR